MTELMTERMVAKDRSNPERRKNVSVLPCCQGIPSETQIEPQPQIELPLKTTGRGRSAGRLVAAGYRLAIAVHCDPWIFRVT